MKGNHQARATNREQRGVALIMGLFLVIFALGITITGTIFLNANRTSVRMQFVLNGQAAQFARSGLIEALNWMRRQNTQPVATFDPVRDASVDPQILDTEEPDIGLVRSFKISGTTWGRYEVWKEWDSDPDSTRLPFRQLMQARDVSAMRGQSGAGKTWLLKAIGYAYERRDAGKAFDERPNRILAQETLEMEVARLSFNLPGQAAINAADGSGVRVGPGTEVLGGGSAAGIYYATGTGTPFTPGTVTGSPPEAPAIAFDGSPEAIFGVSEDALRAVADQVITNPSDFPDPIPAGSIIFVDTDITFTSSLPISGNGIVYFTQNVQSAAGNTSLFSGVIYVKQDLNLAGPAEFRGSIVGMAVIDLSSSGGLVSIIHDQAVLDGLQNSFGIYRASRTIRRVHAR